MSRIRGNIRRHRVGGATTVALGALLLLAGIAMAKPVTVSVENLEVTFNIEITPKTVSRARPTPVALAVNERVRTLDGTHPPALQELVLESERTVAVDARGLPACHPGFQTDPPSSPRELCKEAIVGAGEASIEIAFAEAEPIVLQPNLLLFNGGLKNGITTLYAYMQVTVPVPSAIIVPIKIEKTRNGRLGTRSVFSVPKIAGGSGSITSFALKLDKKFTYKGKKASLVTLKCPNRNILGHAEAVFADGAQAEVSTRTPCLRG